MIVLDTHAFVWWVNGDNRLSSAALDAIRSELSGEEGRVLISAISAWEVALLVDRGRLALSMDVDDWLDTAAEIEGVQFVAIDNDVAVQSVRLPGAFHPDPADRMIVALARHLSATLITADDRIRAYKHVKTLW